MSVGVQSTAESVSAPAELVQVKGLRKRYVAGAPEAVAGIDFSIHEREIFGLLGPNGAGKTTTIGVLTTRVKASAGTVLIGGHSVATNPISTKLLIAVVPQLSNLDRSLTAFENLTFHAAYFGAGRSERRRRAQELLDRFGLGDRGGDLVNDFSGGMAQRLMIARALMHEPRLLILDEPTTGLDPQSRLFLWEMMADLRERGVTLLLTTHDMAEADRLCDRIAVVDHGEIIALDTPQGLRRLLPAEHALEIIVEGGTDPAAGLRGLRGVERVDSFREEERWRLRVYHDDADDGQAGSDGLAASVLATLNGDGHGLIELRRLEGSLEDVFVYLTGREMR